MKNVYLFFLLFLSIYKLHSQTARKYSNEFLSIGVDAAALGMSKSVTASTADVNAIYWNPAGLAKVSVNQAALMHTSQFAGIGNYDYAAVAFAPEKAGELAMGISFIRFGVDDILNTTNLIDSDGNINYNNISLFSAADYALSFAIAKDISTVKGLSFGVNTKVIRRIIGDFATAWGFGFDAGLQYQISKWQFGLMVRDITTTVNTWSINQAGFEQIKNAIDGQNNELPETTEITIPKAHLGIARTFDFPNKDFQLLGEIDLHTRFVQTNDIIANENFSIDPSIGFQLNYQKIVYLRLGAGNFQNIPDIDEKTSLSLQPNVGLGFSYHGIQIDYALSNIASTGNALYSNTFSVKVDFDFLNKK